MVIASTYDYIYEMYILNDQRKFTNLNLNGDLMTLNFPANQEKRVDKIIKIC